MTLTAFAILVATGAAFWWLFTTIVAVPDMSEFDQPEHGLRSGPTKASSENEKVLELIADLQSKLKGNLSHRRLFVLRRLMDEGFTGSPSDAESLGVEILPTTAAGVMAEWTLAPGAPDDRRLLYLHGGAFTIGSQVSHRMITAALSKACGVSVLAINYRLMPENRRIQSVRDCQAAYRWMLENGPNGVADASEIIVAGDSAGGNLTLMLSAWARDERLRQMDCAIAFSPNTDASLSNPLIRHNRHTDPMLGPGLDPLLRLPGSVRSFVTATAGQLRPRNPLISPLFGDLSKLPPTLVQASECEMLLGDAIRYVNKARAAGSMVELQVWPGMVHVWQMFQHVLPEARQAIEDVAVFIQENSSARQVENVSNGGAGDSGVDNG